jgi:hypothetical protein
MSVPLVESGAALESMRVQRTGIISSYPILGGLYHHYVRV